MFNQSQLRWLAVWLLRVALAFSFLSAVADRFGLWGRFGVAGVAWGDFERFTAYTGQLLWFLPSHLVLPAAMLATVAELIVAGGLLAGWRLHSWAFAAAALLLSFALAMTFALGVKAPIDYSVWTAAAAAFLLGVVALREHGTDGTRAFDAESPQTEAVRPGSRDPEGGQLNSRSAAHENQPTWARGGPESLAFEDARQAGDHSPAEITVIPARPQHQQQHHRRPT